MAVNQLSKGPVRAGSIQVGDGSTFGGIVAGTVAINPASIDAGAAATVDVTIAGVVATDVVVLEAPATLEAGLVVKGVRAKAGGVDLDLYNASGGAVDGASLTWTYKVLKVT